MLQLELNLMKTRTRGGVSLKLWQRESNFSKKARLRFEYRKSLKRDGIQMELLVDSVAGSREWEAHSSRIVGSLSW